METEELFTKDTLLYKKNGRYKNLIKAYDLYATSIINNNGITINDIFIDRITELNKNLIENTTCADLIRFVCYIPKKKCYRKSFIEFYNKIAKIHNNLEHLTKEPTRLVIVKEKIMNNRQRNKAKANLMSTISTLERLEFTNNEALEKLKLIGINLPKELLEDPKVESLLGDNHECQN